MLYTMKPLVVITVILLNVRLGTSGFNLISSLPAGEYRMKIKAILNCNPTKDNEIQLNLYPIQKDEVTELRGNVTARIPIDDRLSLEAVIAMKETNGAWKENLFIHKSPKACSAMRNLLGNSQWIAFLATFGLDSKSPDSCVIPKGVHLTTGALNTSIIQQSNFPKTFIYGTFKMRLSFGYRPTDMFGCTVYIVELKRPRDLC